MNKNPLCKWKQPGMMVLRIDEDGGGGGRQGGGWYRKQQIQETQLS